MGPAEMSTLSSTSTSDSSMLLVLKLHDDRSNWSDYQLRLECTMGSRGLWRHVLENTIALKPLQLVNGIHVLSDGKTEATEEQIESKEARIADFEKREYFAQHILLSSTLTCLGSKLKALKSLKDMWKIIKEDVTTKSTLFLIDTEEQLSSMKLADNDDAKTHLSEIRQHFELVF